MFKINTLKILSVIVFLSAMVSNVYSMDHSLDGRIEGASSKLYKVAKDMACTAAHLVWENPVPFVVAGACVLLPQVSAMPTVGMCTGIMKTLGETVQATEFLIFNNSIVLGLRGTNLSCFNVPKTLASGPWNIGTYVCDLLYPITLICPAPGQMFCTQDPYTGDNARCWGK